MSIFGWLDTSNVGYLVFKKRFYLWRSEASLTKDACPALHMHGPTRPLWSAWKQERLTHHKTGAQLGRTQATCEHRRSERDGYCRCGNSR